MSIPLVLSPCALVAFLFGLIATVFWIWMLIHCIQNPRLDGTTRLIWILVTIFLHGLGALLYFFLGKESTGPMDPR